MEFIKPRSQRQQPSPIDSAGSERVLKVTAIKAQVKRAGRYSIFVNGSYAFSLSEQDLISSGLRESRQLTVDDINHFRQLSDFGKLYDRVLGFLAIRMRSEQEIRQYIKRTVYKQQARTSTRIGRQTNQENDIEASPTPAHSAAVDEIDSNNRQHRAKELARITEEIIERIKSYGYINDATFAKSWVVDRRMMKKRSSRYLQRELHSKGIAADIIKAVLSDGADDERQALKELIAKKRRLSRFADDQKLKQYLLRQGFGYSLIAEMLISNESQDEAAFN